MGEMITKPDANPILFALMNFFTWGFLGYFLMGQKKKAIAAVVYTFIGLWLCGIGMLIPWIASFDAYQLGNKLAGGESIGESENALGFLNSLPGWN